MSYTKPTSIKLKVTKEDGTSGARVPLVSRHEGWEVVAGMVRKDGMSFPANSILFQMTIGTAILYQISTRCR